MDTYISLLRGINVSGQKKIKMTQLRALYESLGLACVRTYIQSGNVIFADAGGDADALANRVAREIERVFAFPVTVLIRSATDLRHIIAENPFARRKGIDLSKLHVTFLAAAPDTAAVARLQSVACGDEEFILAGRDVYLHCPNGYGRAKLTNTTIEKKLGGPATTRNWQTVNALAELAVGGADC